MASTPIRIVFLGTSSFAVPSLKALATNKAFSVDLVVTQPDRPAGRKQELTASPVKQAALELGLPVLQPDDIRTERATIMKMIGSEPDFLVCIAYGQILNQDILALATRAPVNVHGSLLPRWRGASPVHHAILANDHESGVTVQRMVEKLDAGPVLSQSSTALDDRETFESLYERLRVLGGELLPRTLSAYNGTETAQDDSKVTVCRKLSREDGVVDTQTMTAEQIDRKVRALVPWPGVTWNDIKILASDLVPQKDAWEVSCANGTKLYVTLLQPAGKKAMTGAEYERGKK